MLALSPGAPCLALVNAAWLSSERYAAPTKRAGSIRPSAPPPHHAASHPYRYRSGFYWFDDEQKALIEASKAAYEKALGKGRKITTETAAASDYDKYGGLFYYGEGYHQQYLAKPGARPYCSAQPQCVALPPFEQWVPPGLEHHAPKLPAAFWKKHGPTPHCVINSPNEPIPWGSW